MRSASRSMEAVVRRVATQFSSSVPLFGGGGISPSALAITLALHSEQTVFSVWAAAESALLAARMTSRVPVPAVLSAKQPINWRFATCELLGAASVGFGSAALISMQSALGAGLGWMTAAAFAGETCVRGIGSQRLVVAMLILGAVPAIVACAVSGDKFFQVSAALTALFVARMALAGNRMNAMLVDSLRAERESDHRSRHDRLTGLLNRSGLEREVELMRQDDPHADLTLFFIDMDGLKAVNDTQGHRAGDELLRTVAEQLLEFVGSNDVIARLGGDEFVVVTALDLVEPAEFGAALLKVIRQTRISTTTSQVTASIGVAQTSARACNLVELLALADLRQYAAKRAGGDRCAIIDPSDSPVAS